MLRQIIAAQRAAGSLLALTVDYAHEAEACLLDQRVDEAQEAVEQGFNIMQAHNERLWESELWRIRGEVLLADHPAKIADATHCFETAWQLAMDRSGLMMQLRAGLSLARIQGNKSQRQQALKTLAELLNQFQEGQQTADLIEARGLVAAR